MHIVNVDGFWPLFGFDSQPSWLKTISSNCLKSSTVAGLISPTWKILIADGWDTVHVYSTYNTV